MNRTDTRNVSLRHSSLAARRWCARASIAGAALTLLGVAPPASASERHFNSVYESGVLAPGHVELEPWTTWRYGRTDYYSRFDNRLEFEVGVVDKLQTSLYWNFSSAAADELVDPANPAAGKTRVSEFEFEGISSEWKLKLMDPVADALGLALYLEGSLGPTEAEIEGKVIVDKRVGDFLVAANAVTAVGWDLAAPGAAERELELGLDAGAGYFVSPSVLVGLELRHVNILEDGKLATSIVDIGPTAAYAGEGWWVSGSVLPQVLAFKGSSPGSRLDLTTEERLRVRVNFGFQL